MPRTKIVKKNAQLDENNSKLKILLSHMQNKKKCFLENLEIEKKKIFDLYETVLTEEKRLLSHKYIHKTIKEIVESKYLQTTESVSTLNITKSIKKERKPVKRSISFAVDEGYLTADSTNSSERESRSRTKMKRRTRSLSKGNLSDTGSTYKTPANKKPTPTYGVVTPKCNPSNTAQILLRRPKNGEVALSMQGSPLYTASVVSENMANINIPLLDGRMLTLQPQRGLQVSQIPQLDPQTLHQLKVLRENLVKVCAASTRQK